MKSHFQENIPLAPFTTLSIGGPARYFTQALSENTVLEAIDFAKRKELPLFVLGGGSNLLVADNGFDGLVLQVAIHQSSYRRSDGSVFVRAGAGVSWDSLVANCVQKKLAGVECLSGIPGWVGGTPIQNVGAYGQEVAGVISRVRAYDRQNGLVVELSNSECAFGYRRSLFNTTARGRYIVLEVEYELKENGSPMLKYPDLEELFSRTNSKPNLCETREAVREIRLKKAMLLVNGDPDCRSVGSFFKNPIVSEYKSKEIKNMGRFFDFFSPDDSFPCFQVSDGGYKLSAAWLIEHSGFGKGYCRENAGLSAKHTLALINRGGATAQDVLGLAGEIINAVEDVFGIRLQVEPAFVGFPPEVQKTFGVDDLGGFES